MAIRIQLRRDTAANWTSANPVLRAGEVGIETDTLKFKIGNGSSTWTQITNYANITPSSLSNSLNDYILAADQGNPGGPAELDSNGDLIIPEDSIILWNDGTYSYTTTLTATQPTADRTITFPDVSGTVVTTGDTGSVTNTMLAGSIANNKLTNSSVTINTNSVSLGGSLTLDTDDVAEGTTNKYFSDELAQDAAAAALAAGTHTNITVTYNDNSNSISLAAAPGYTNEEAQDAVGNAVGNGLDYDDSTGAISVDPSEFTLNSVGVPTADVSLASYKITNLATPTAASDAATKAYVDNTTAGLNFHAPAHAATTTNLTATYNNGTSGVGATLTGTGTFPQIDTHTVAEQERVLVKNQSNGFENGLYVLTDDGDPSGSWVLTRATDADNSPAGEIAYGDFCFIQNGGQAGYGFIVNTKGTITIGSTNISYIQFNAGQVVVAGNGLQEATAGTLSINTAVTADLSTSQTFTNKTLTSPKINEDVVLTATATELNYVDGVTSAIQTQLDGKVDESLFDAKGDLLVASADNTPAKLTVGTNGYILTANSSATNGIEWAAAPISLPDQTGNAGEYLTTDGTTASWAVVPVTSAATPTTLGTVYGIFDTANENLGLGYGSFNTTSDGVYNIAIGSIALPDNTTGNENIAIGYTALSYNTTGGQNVAIGSQAMEINESGNKNTAVGYNAQNGTAVGSRNSAYGTYSLYQVDGDDNVAVGYYSGFDLTTGSNNIIIGSDSAASSATVSNEITLGNTSITRFRVPGLGIDWTAAPIIRGTATLSANTTTSVDTNALSTFTSAEYVLSLKQGSKVRTSKVLVQTDGTSVDMTEFAITETGGTMSGVVISAIASGSDAVLQATVTDASSTNVTVKFSKVKL